jgi:Copper type II ascorbate-dependent monooxygenase, C-terminal domain
MGKETIMMSKCTIAMVAMVATGMAVGCGSDPAGPLLPPPRAGEGVQIVMTSTIEAHFETERCMFYRVPADGLYVNREEVRYTPGSHHVLVFKTSYTDIPTTTLLGETVDTAGVFDCGANGATGDWDVVGVAGGAQSADGPPGVDGLPSDTAFKIEGGSLLLINAHYLNAGDKPLDAEIFINLHTIPAAQVTREAGIFFLFNPFIHVPAQSSSQAREVCPLAAGVTLVNAQSHMHARGVDYVADLLDASGTKMQELYTNRSWEHVVSKSMEPPLSISAGQMIDFRCSYVNNETHDINRGRTTRDEMCMFIGLYYPKDTKTEVCSMNNDWSGRYLGANWIGSGTATGLQTAGCLQAATASGSEVQGAIDACVVKACAGISAETSNAVRCLATRGYGMCAEMCGGAAADPAACMACSTEKCTPVMTTLAGTACP